jgi:hypothetical protein
MKYKNTDGTGKFSAFPSLLFADCTYYCFQLFPNCTCYCFTNCVLSLFFLFFFLVSFQVPLISCASPWRAGETRNGASPKYFRYCLQNFFVILYIASRLCCYYCMVIYLRCLQNLCIYILPHVNGDETKDISTNMPKQKELSIVRTPPPPRPKKAFFFLNVT